MLMTKSLMIVLLLLAQIPSADASNNAADCYQTAREKTDLSSDDALNLCRQQSSTAPVDCYLRVTEESMLSRLEAMHLCRCAPSAETAECYLQARSQTFLTREEAVRLCSGQTGRSAGFAGIPISPEARPGDDDECSVFKGWTG